MAFQMPCETMCAVPVERKVFLLGCFVYQLNKDKNCSFVPGCCCSGANRSIGRALGWGRKLFKIGMFEKDCLGVNVGSINACVNSLVYFSSVKNCNAFACLFACRLFSFVLKISTRCSFGESCCYRKSGIGFRCDRFQPMAQLRTDAT